jgi:hypothetical protein
VNEYEIAQRFVLRHISSNADIRKRMAEKFTDVYVDMDAEYLLSMLKAHWIEMDDSEKLSWAQALAGVRHYNAFMVLMNQKDLTPLPVAEPIRGLK